MSSSESGSLARCSDYWENRYQTGQTNWEKGEAAPGLLEFLAAHPEMARGTVVVPGCGTGHDVRALASAGFVATGVDFAPSAIATARDRTIEAGLDATFRLCDFLAEAPEQPFDWLFEHTLFCAIPPTSRDDYLRALLAWTRPGSGFLAIHYLCCEGGPPWPVTRDEVIGRFSPSFNLLGDWQPRSYPNRVGKEWMFWWQRKQA